MIRYARLQSFPHRHPSGAEDHAHHHPEVVVIMIVSHKKAVSLSGRHWRIQGPRPNSISLINASRSLHPCTVCPAFHSTADSRAYLRDALVCHPAARPMLRPNPSGSSAHVDVLSAPSDGPDTGH